MNAAIRADQPLQRLLDLTLMAAQMTLALPAVVVMLLGALIPEAVPAPVPADLRFRAGLAQALAALERERIKHSVLSETFFALTKLREEYKSEIERNRP
jgi:hypothetical protein